MFNPNGLNDDEIEIAKSRITDEDELDSMYNTLIINRILDGGFDSDESML